MEETQSSSQPIQETPAVTDPRKRSKRNRVLLKTFAALVLVGLLTFAYWYFFVRLYKSTDDAYVNGNAIMLMAPESGITVAIYADNTNYVQQGQLLVELDPILYRLAFDKAQVDLALAARQVQQLWEDVQQRKADLTLRETELRRAREDFEDRAGLQHTQAISKEDFSHARADHEVAQATVNVAHHQLESAIAALGSTPLEKHPLIENAKIALRNSYVDLVRRKILAPAEGWIAQRRVQVGEWVTATRALLSLIPLNQIWVDANFKETQLERIRIGQPVTLTTDMYGSGVVYHGKVQGIVAGTGSVFSLIPPQNATGNWIKIVQRVPVRIALDPQEVKEHPLLLGLSVYATVDTTDLSGLQLADQPLYAPQFSTTVFDVDMRPTEILIQSIIQSNLNPSPGPDA